MPQDDLSSLLSAAEVGGVVVLSPPRKEWQGPVVLRKAVTLRGGGGTVWAEKGPVVVVEGPGVVLEDLNVEVTGPPDKLGGEEACAVVVRGGHTLVAKGVGVRGDVVGVPGEGVGWRYPLALRLGKLRADSPHVFRARLILPVPCRVESKVAGLDVRPRDLPAGPAEVELRVEKLPEHVRLRGAVLLIAGSITRRIELSAHAATGPGTVSGVGQLAYEPPDWALVADAASVTAAPVEEVVTDVEVVEDVPKAVEPPVPTRKKGKVRFTDPHAVPSVFGTPAKGDDDESKPDSHPLASPLWSPPTPSTPIPPTPLPPPPRGADAPRSPVTPPTDERHTPTARVPRAGRVRLDVR